MKGFMQPKETTYFLPPQKNQAWSLSCSQLNRIHYSKIKPRQQGFSNTHTILVSGSGKTKRGTRELGESAGIVQSRANLRARKNKGG